MILGIETATSSVGVALGGPDGAVASFQLTKGQRHAETLAPSIRFVCQQAGVELDSLEAVAVDVGPGLFTGLRVGVASAQAIAQALRIPLVVGSSLELLAYPFRFRSGGLVASVVDARRQEVYFALYRPRAGHLERLSPEHVGSPDSLLAALTGPGEPCLAVGEGALRYAQVLERPGAVELAGRDSAYPQASALVELGWTKFCRDEVVQAGGVRVSYLRKADARVNYERREQVAAGSST